MKTASIKEKRHLERLLPCLEERRKRCSPDMAEDLDTIIAMCKCHLRAVMDHPHRLELCRAHGVFSPPDGRSRTFRKGIVDPGANLRAEDSP